MFIWDIFLSHGTFNDVVYLVMGSFESGTFQAVRPLVRGMLSDGTF
jgi:hypothetical protein